MSATLPRVRAPELRGAGGWINTPVPLSLADLRGKVVLLDFWTLACINCIHVVEELRALEERFADELVVVGVHSPKFPHEHDHAAVADAVARHRLAHPVLDDPDMNMWSQYGVRAWPTLVLIDPDGYVVGGVAGEGHGKALGTLVADLVADAERRGVLRRGPLEPAPSREDTGPLAYPGKVASDGADRLAIADTGHDRVLVVGLDGTLQAELAPFDQPQGVRFDGDELLVCETVAGRVWRVGLDGHRELLAEGLSSPWDVVREGDRLVVAEAGRHRLWAIEDGQPAPLAGTGGESLEDGPALAALLAQPSGLTVLPGGGIAFADSEASALRVLAEGRVTTLVGRGLFEWGRDDGPATVASLQHPLGVAAAPDGTIWVADTFNGLVRAWRGDRLSTLPVGGLLEPGGLDVLPDGRLVVADTNHHRIVLVDPASNSLEPLEIREPSAAARASSAESRLARPANSTWRLSLDLDLEGDDLDPAGGPPVRLSVEADPPELLASGPVRWRGRALPAEVEVRLGRGQGTIRAELVVASCSGDLCRLRRRQAQWQAELT